MKFSNSLLIVSILISTPVCAETALKGTGSYLAGPLYLKWIEARRQDHKDVKIQYEIRDSAQGVERAINHGSDFATTDTPFTLDEERRMQSRGILRLPVAVEAVAITYNLPGVPTGLKLTPWTLSEIFMGNIKKWNDPAIKESNPGVSPPDMEIRVVHREEESALHDLFPSYLAKLNSKWTLKREKEKNLHWPVGQSVKGNEKVYEKLRLWPGVIAAVDLTYAIQKNLPVAALKNATGNFVAPSGESLAAAASDLQNLPEDFQVILAKSHAKQAYPLCAFSYLLVQRDFLKTFHDHKRGEALVDFLNWIFSDGQKMESDLSYAPLPESFLSQVMEKVKAIKY